MHNHLWSLGSLCDVLPSYVAIGADFLSAFTSLSQVFILSVLKLFRLPANYIRLVMIVMKAPQRLMVGVRPVRVVMCLRECGIHHGDCLSPPIFSLRASFFLWQLSGKGLLDSVYVFMYVDDVMFVFAAEHNFDLVERVMTTGSDKSSISESEKKRRENFKDSKN